LIPYTLEPGNYKVTAVTGSINFLSHDNAGNDIAASHSPSLANEGIKNTFTMGAAVGVAVGSAVGVAVGSAVGVAVGSAVGVAVGSAVGDDFAPALWLTLCAGSLAALALLLKKRHI